MSEGRKEGKDRQRAKPGRNEGDRKVIFDTNSLLVPAQFGVDVFDEVERLVGGYEGLVPQVVVEEVRELDEDGAEMGLEMALENCDVVEDEGEYADNTVVSLAEEEGDAVVTNDSELRERVLDAGVPVIYLRQKSYLEIQKP
ncbi:MAG: twitching motility protein PilT [Halobacteria archaeon]|nr:twitching motility protein PilT [Halobacteria archaeon]